MKKIICVQAGTGCENCGHAVPHTKEECPEIENREGVGEGTHCNMCVEED